MPTGNFSAELRREVADALLVLRFRRSLGSRRLRWAAWLMVVITVTLAVVPVLFPPDPALTNAMPWIWLGFPLLTISASVASGGGRELLPAGEAVAFPIGRIAEYAGSLLLAPLNIAWLLQAWSLLAITGHVTGRILPSAVLTLAWIVLGTTLGQAIGWSLEWVRRAAGAVFQRVLLALLGLIAGGIALGGYVVGLRRALGIDALLDAAAAGSGWLVLVPLLVLGGLAVALLGILPARRALGLPRADEERLDSDTYAPRPHPGSETAMLLRIDRASLWRTVPFRRGLLLLAALPIVGGLAGAVARPLPWTLVVMVPGLVASGVALLFGVNAWSLDGRGVLWRESLPVSPGRVFAARLRVIAEATSTAVLPGVLLLGVLATIGSGTPSTSVLAAVVGAWLATTCQVLSACTRWSLTRPYAVDLRSARSTPAPPVVMVGYATRLSISTSLTGLLYVALALTAWWITAAVTLPLVGWSTWRIGRAARRWRDPVVRATVLARVAA